MSNHRIGVSIAILLLPVVATGGTAPAPDATVQPESVTSSSFAEPKPSRSRATPHTWLKEGGTLSTTVVEFLEADLASHPEDLATRVRLIGCLNNSAFNDHRLRWRRSEHIQWLIEHKFDEGPQFWGHLFMFTGSEGPEASLKATSTWKRHLDDHPSSTPLIESAASFLIFVDKKATLDIYSRGAKLCPQDPHWPTEIALIHLLQARNEDRNLQYTEASLALKFYEQAIALTKDIETGYPTVLQWAAQAAWLVDRADKAVRWANLLLKSARAGEWWFAYATHHGHTILGLAALDEGRIDVARKALMLSVDFGDPSVELFGPAMELAAALLEKGDRDLVIEYLESLKSSVKFKPERFDEMAAEIRRGDIPDDLKSALKKLAGRKPAPKI